MAEEMEKEDWIKSAVPNNEQKDIIVTTTDGYIYQVYYDEETGKKEIDFIGKDDGDEEGIPTITARYDKVKAVITAEAKCKGGIKEIQLIYKKEIVQTQPGETANFKVQKTGWYQIKAVANNGKTRSTWIRVSSTVIAPLIEVISDGEQENDWYGKDDKPVEVRISTDNPTVTKLYYKTNKDEEYTCVEGREATITIQESGRTIIYAYVTDKYENESEQGNKEIKYDNIHPEVGELEIEGTKGVIEGTETGWYVSEEVIIKLDNMTDEPSESGIVGYYYWEIPEGINPNEITEEQKTYVKGTTGQIKITKEGKVTIGIQSKDKAGNITKSTKTITIYKDDEAPIDFLPSIVNGSITSNGFTITAGATDAISGISHYNFYVKQGATIVKESRNNEEGRMEVTGLEANTIYSITVEAVDKAGNIRIGTGITGTTKGKVITPTISISPTLPNGSNSWYNNGNITVTINDGETDSTKSGVTGIVYTLNGVTTTVQGRTATVTISIDGIHTIKAYATDGTRNSAETSIYTIKRDVTDPSASLGTPTNVTTNSMTVIGTAQDLMSGVKSYKFDISTDSNFSTITKTQTYTITTPTTNLGTQSHTFSGLNEGTTYYIRVIVTDEAGRTKTSNIVTQRLNTPPTKAVVSLNSKGTNYIKVNAKSEDVDGDKLTYTLYYGTSASSLTNSTPLADQTQNVQIVIQTPTNLSQYTYYYWRVDVSDGKATTQGDVQAQVRTYCQAKSCSGGSYSSVTCPKTTTTTSTCGWTQTFTGTATMFNSDKPCTSLECTSPNSGTSYHGGISCDSCGGWINWSFCGSCMNSPGRGTIKCKNKVTKEITCSLCGGSGSRKLYYNCEHGYSYGSSHYYCSETGHGNYKGSSSLHD